MRIIRPMPTRKITRLARLICFGASVEAANMMATAGKSMTAWRRTKKNGSRWYLAATGGLAAKESTSPAPIKSSRPKNIRRSTVNHQSERTLLSARVILMPPFPAVSRFSRHRGP